MKIGANGSGSTRTKLNTKPSSASRQDNHPSFVGTEGFLKQRRGSAMTTCSNNTSRYASIEDPKRKHLSSKESIKTYNSVTKPKDTESKTAVFMAGGMANKSHSKNSLPGHFTLQLSNNLNQKYQDNDSICSSAKRGNSATGFSNCDSGSLTKAKHLMSTVSVASQSSTGSSTLSTINGLKEINKVILSKNANPRKELLSNRDNKVYSYKLNQLISIIKSSQSTTNKKTVSKKPTATKTSSVSYNKKSCRKVTKTNRKLPKKTSKSSVTCK